jgi:hypothetical protein
MILLLFIPIWSSAQVDDITKPNLIFSPLKMAVGSRFGTFDNWNKQLDAHSYNTVNLNNETTFEFSLYLKNHLVIKSMMSINSQKDSTFINNRKIDYKRRMYGLNIGYNMFSIEKICNWVIVPSVGVYAGHDKIACTSRSQINPYQYDMNYQILTRYDAGINPNIYISVYPFSDYNMFSFLGVGIDIGAFYNMNLLHTTQYKNSLDGIQIQQDKQLIPYIKISFELLRGIFYYQNEKQKNKQFTSSLSNT